MIVQSPLAWKDAAITMVPVQIQHLTLLTTIAVGNIMMVDVELEVQVMVMEIEMAANVIIIGLEDCRREHLLESLLEVLLVLF